MPAWALPAPASWGRLPPLPLALRPIPLANFGFDRLDQFSIGLELVQQFIEIVFCREVLSSGPEVRNT